jgi:outer membrane protein TolC
MPSKKFKKLQLVTRFSVVSILLTSLVSRSETGSLDLQTAVSVGLEQSSQVQLSKAKYEEAKAKKTSSMSGFLPSVNAQVGHLLNEQFQVLDVPFGGQTIPFAQVFPYSFWGINADLPLFDGFRNYAMYYAASIAADSAEKEYRWNRFQVEQDIKLKFYQSLAAQKLKDVAEQNLKTLNDHYQQTEALKKGGVATGYDLLRVGVQMNEAKTDVLRVTDDVEVSRRRLVQSMGLDSDDRVLVGDLPVPDEKKVQGTKWAQEDSLKLSAMQDLLDAAHKKETADSRFWMPRVSLDGQWISYNNVNDLFGDTSNYRWGYNIGLNLSWNLFDGMKSIGESQSALQARVQSEKALTLARQQTQVDFEYWQKKFVYSANLYRAKLTEIEQATESVRLSREGYKVGSRTSSEVLDAELDLFRARAGVVNSQMSSVESLISLELALGRPMNR